MEAFSYVLRCIIVLIFSWLCVRIIGKKSVSQMTSYDFVAFMVLSNVAAEPLVFKITSKSFVGVFTITLLVIAVGWLSLHQKFYNVDEKPDIVIINGKIDQKVLKHNRLNIPLLLSLLRLQGYANISDIAYAIIEPNGNLSVLPKSENRPLCAKDLSLRTQAEELPIPLVIEGKLQIENLKYANISEEKLNNALQNAGSNEIQKVFLAMLNSDRQIHVEYYDHNMKKPKIF